MAKIAVIGTGGWGKNHARVLSELNALNSICDIDQQRAEALAGKYGVNWYTSVDDLLKNEKPDGAVISTPTVTHFAIAKQVMYSMGHYRYLSVIPLYYLAIEPDIVVLFKFHASFNESPYRV